LAQVFGAQQLPSALHTSLAPLALFGQSFVSLPLQPSSNEPHATASASGGNLGAHGAPHLPLLLHTSGLVQLPQLTNLPPQLVIV